MQQPIDTIDHHARAQSMLSAIQKAPVHPMPRRDAIQDWLKVFLDRTQDGSPADEAEVRNLKALERFFKEWRVVVEAPLLVEANDPIPEVVVA